ncbi:MAG: glycoside hydrolase domain-containing protein [Tepidisphaeraceae bacterium]
MPLDLANFDPLKLECSPLPSSDWTKAAFNDHCWPRYCVEELDEFLGGYGASVEGNAPSPTVLHLRTCFGIADPAKATDLKLTLRYLGGCVAYINGEEVGRAHLPPGPVVPLTPAEDYTIEAYTMADGVTPLPPPSRKTGEMDLSAGADRYEKRIRNLAVNVPARLLVRGRNVLAIELHRAPRTGPSGGRDWSHLGIRDIRLTSAAGTGAIPYREAVQGTHVWSANSVDQVAETFPEKSLLHRNWHWNMIWGRGLPVRGVQQGNPFDPVLPLKLSMPRNGVGSGQTVLSDPDGLRGVGATLGSLKGPGGAVIPAANVQLRYAVQVPGVHYCNALHDQPPEGAKTVPVWLVIRAAKDQTPGWYTAPLSLQANGKQFTVPVQTLVTGYVLPEAKDFNSDINVVQSPDSIAAHYRVEPWSDAHFKLLEPSLALMGQLGNDVIHVQVITRNRYNAGAALVRFTKTSAGLKPDFTLLERYLDLYGKHCAAPKAVCLHIWDQFCVKRAAFTHENDANPSRENKPRTPLMVALWDPESKTVTETDCPHVGDEGSEAFYKQLVDGLRAIVLKRGWPERCILLGMGQDARPSMETAALMRQWTPYARWYLLSHFAADPGGGFTKNASAKAVAAGDLLAGKGGELLKVGKFIAIGGLEIGIKEHPWSGPRWGSWNCGMTALEFEAWLARHDEFLDIGTARWLWQAYSPPMAYRTMPSLWGNLGRIGLDFWNAGTRGNPHNTDGFTAIESVTAPGPAGAIPTVQFQMLREGVQDAELRWAIIRAYSQLPVEDRKPYRAILDEQVRRIASGNPWYLSQSELCYDWPAYVARLHQTAAELAHVKSDAKWDSPPR